MRGCLWIFLTSVVLDSLTVKANINGILVNKFACRGGSSFNTTAGTITSPLSLRGPPTRVSCSWILQNPNEDYVILSFNMFNLDHASQCGKKSCCLHQWLMLITEPPGARKRRDIVSSRRKSRESVEDSLKRNIQRHKLLKVGIIKDLGKISNRRRTMNHHKDARITGSGKRGNNTSSNSGVLHRPRHSPTPFSPSDFRTTGRICGNSTPQPIITRAPRVVVQFYSDIKIRRDHTGFSLQFFKTGKTVCKDDEFQCANPKICVPNTWKCNGQAECPDSSDEMDCKAGCAGLIDSQHCDGRWHCPKGEDELGCFGCDADEWWCGESTYCYKASRRCDGIPDCHNKADEVYCSCLFNQTQCAPNSEFCYDPETQRCDGTLHCPGGQDELDCGDCLQAIPCGIGGGCYKPAQRCDGASQCGDGSDEALCTPQLCNPQHGAFLCANRRCIRDARRCDEYDDCGDASDEKDCLRNSEIVAAAMGGLVCSLLLVIAVGCTCRLYALRLGLGQRHRYQGGRRSTPLAPLSRLEQHLLQREPPPSYSVAINDPSTSLWTLSRHWRRHRRRPLPPPEGLVPGMPVTVRGRLAPSPPCHDAGTGQPAVPGTVGRQNSRSGDEKDSEEEGKPAGTCLPVPVQGQVPLTLGNEEDVPLLSAVGDSEDDTETSEREDARLLDISTGEDSDCDEGDASSTDTSVAEAEVMSDDGQYKEETDQEIDEIAELPADEDACAATDDDSLLELEDDTKALMDSDSQDGEDGDVMMDTRAAVRALSVVQHHTNGISQVDTELISQ